MTIQEILDTRNYHLVDVREPMELITDGAIEGALNVPLSELEERKDEILNLKGNIIFFCKSGGRSGKAVDFFKEKGISNIYNGGGYNDLSKLV
ncbi:MAG: rhodanese-like domain-containing protein [Flavobacteriaceae bacterium]